MFFPSVHIGFHSFVLPETLPERRSSIVWKVRGAVYFGADSPVGGLCCPSPPSPAVLPCAAPYRPGRGMSGFCIRQVGLHEVSFVRAFRGSSKTVFYDAPEGKRLDFFLVEPTRRRPVLPGLAPPRRPAVCRPAQTCPWYVRGLDLTSKRWQKSPVLCIWKLEQHYFPRRPKEILS